jgi:integrase
MKSGVRILRPSEYDQLRTGARTLENQTRSDALLLTGLRYVEAQRLQRNPDWVDGRFIHLPPVAQKKVKRQQKERWVKLSSRGTTLIPFFFKSKPLPTWKAWSEDLKRWACNSQLDPVGLGPKSMRKTWESWLVASYPERVLEVFLSQGHTQMTALTHYLGLPFTQGDKDAMLEYVSGWA